MRTFAAITLFLLIVGCGKKPEPTTPAAAPSGGLGPNPDSTLPDKERFQGVWLATSSDSGAGPKELKGDRVPRLQVEGDRASLRESITDPGAPHAASWDTTKNPKTLTLAPLNADGIPGHDFAQVWIYKIEGDTLVAAFGSEKNPPSDFKAQTASPRVTVLKFTRTTEKPIAQPKRPVGGPPK